MKVVNKIKLIIALSGSLVLYLSIVSGNVFSITLLLITIAIVFFMTRMKGDGFKQHLLRITKYLFLDVIFFSLFGFFSTLFSKGEIDYKSLIIGSSFLVIEIIVTGITKKRGSVK